MMQVLAWIRVVSCLFLAVTIFQVSAMTNRIQRALQATGVLFIIYAAAATAFALGRADVREFILDYVQTPYMVVTIFVWMVTFWKIGRSVKS
jgi:hypothetical protein